MPEAVPTPPSSASVDLILVFGGAYLLWLIVVLFIARAGVRKDGIKLTALLKSWGWENFQSCWVDLGHPRYKAVIDERPIVVQYGVPERDKGLLLIRISFQTKAKGFFTLKRRPQHGPRPFYMRSIWLPPKLIAPIPEFIAEGKDPQMILERFRCDGSAKVLREALTGPHDCIRFKKHKIIVDKEIRYPSWPEVSLYESVVARGEDKALAQNAKLAHGLVTHLLAIGF